MKQIALTKARLDNEYAEKIENELINYYDKHKPYTTNVNIIKDNTKRAETALSVSMKQMVYSHNNYIHQLRQNEAMNKKAQMLDQQKH